MKLALITGGSKGLGKSLMEKFLHEGFKVHEFSRSGKSENNIWCDFTDPEKAAQIIGDALFNLSDIGYSEIYLINNAGTIDPTGPITEFKTKDWIDNININLNSAIITSGKFIKHFQHHSCKKAIISISSGAAIRAKHGWSLYCAAKAGLEQFCRSLAIEQSTQREPTDVAIVDPGIIDTDMQAKIRKTKKSSFPELDRFIGFHREGQLSSPKWVADKIYEILSGNIKNGAKYSVKDL